MRKFDYPILSFETYDGDTIKVTIDRGFDDTKSLSVRVSGVDTPEIRTLDLFHKKVGKAVGRVVDLWLKRQGIGELMFHSTERDKYSGRGVGLIRFEGDVERPDLTQFLLDNGLARPYRGGRKPDWTDEELSGVADALRMMGAEI